MIIKLWIERFFLFRIPEWKTAVDSIVWAVFNTFSAPDALRTVWALINRDTQFAFLTAAPTFYTLFFIDLQMADTDQIQ